MQSSGTVNVSSQRTISISFYDKVTCLGDEGRAVDVVFLVWTPTAEGAESVNETCGNADRTGSGRSSEAALPVPVAREGMLSDSAAGYVVAKLFGERC